MLWKVYLNRVTLRFVSAIKHCGSGVKHEQFLLFWISIWNWGDYKYVLYNDDSSLIEFYELNQQEVAYLKQLFPELSLLPDLPFWDKWGAKIIIGVLFLKCFW